MINKLFTSKTSKKKIVAPQSNNLKIEKTKSVVKINNIEVKDGACKHYKKSHKLFKFPCCNKVSLYIYMYIIFMINPLHKFFNVYFFLRYSHAQHAII